MVILASKSPRRKEILQELGISFQVYPGSYEENNSRPLPPGELVRLQAEGKARGVYEEIGGDDPILAADTVVAIDGTVLGKPEDEREAVQMLARLSGRTHEVLTGVAVLWKGEMRSAVEKTEVTFRVLEAHEIEDYIRTGEPMDKAGAYAIQGLGARFVVNVKGSWSNVVGLPKDLTLELLGMDRREGKY